MRVFLAVGLEGVQYLLPYRAWNVNDAVGNILGFNLGSVTLPAMTTPPSNVVGLWIDEIHSPRMIVWKRSA